MKLCLNSHPQKKMVLNISIFLLVISIQDLVCAIPFVNSLYWRESEDVYSRGLWYICTSFRFIESSLAGALATATYLPSFGLFNWIIPTKPYPSSNVLTNSHWSVFVRSSAAPSLDSIPCPSNPMNTSILSERLTVKCNRQMWAFLDYQ